MDIYILKLDCLRLAMEVNYNEPERGMKLAREMFEWITGSTVAKPVPAPTAKRPAKKK